MGVRVMRGGLLAITAVLLALLAAGPAALGSARVAHDPGILIAPNRAVAAQEGNPLTAGQADLGTFTPAFIFSDETTAFSIPISGGQFDSVFLTTEGALQPDPSLPTGAVLFRSDLVRLFDDGTNGDVTPGDQIYSRSGIAVSGALPHDGGSHQRVTPALFFLEAAGGGAFSSANRSQDAGLGVVAAAQRGSVSVSALNATVSQTSHALFVVDDGTILPGFPNPEVSAAVLLCRACELLINEFGDVFDFVVIQTQRVVQETPPCECQAFFSPTSNDVSGIGLTVFDNNIGATVLSDGRPLNTFSDGRLQGVIFMNRIDASPLAHEVMHNWGISAAPNVPAPGVSWVDGAGHPVDFSDVNGIMDNSLTGADGSLITGPNGREVDFVANGDGTYRLAERPGEFLPTFSTPSLYLAGFMTPAEAAGTFAVIGGADISNPDIVTVQQEFPFSVQDIITAEGPRVPAAAHAPRDFTLGTVVVSDKPFTDAEHHFFTLSLRYFESAKAYDGSGSPPWQAATQGRSTIQTALPSTQQQPGADALALTPTRTTLEVGEQVTLRVVATDAGVAATDVFVQFQEGLQVAALSGDVVATDAQGVATVEFTATDPGTVTITVVTLVDGQPLATAVTATLTLRVFAVGETPQTALVQLTPQWNLVGATADGPTAESIAAIAADVSALFAWDAAAQNFLSFRPGTLPVLNSLNTLTAGTGVFIFVTAANGAAWELPLITEPRAVPLLAGFNLVMWTGADGTPVADAVAELGPALEALFIWDAVAQGFLSFRPQLPAALNSAQTLNYGDGVWMLMAGAATWNQPAR